MDHRTKTQADDYAQLLNYLTGKVGGDAVVAAELVGQIGKDRRAAAISAERSNGNGVVSSEKHVVHGDEPATESQLSFLRRLNVPIEPGKQLTRQEASDLIDSNLPAK